MTVRVSVLRPSGFGRGMAVSRKSGTFCFIGASYFTVRP
jgi:hypothetical protein